MIGERPFTPTKDDPMTEEQFTPLAQRYMDTVYRVAGHSYLRCRDDALMTQDVLIQLSQRGQGVRKRRPCEKLAHPRYGQPLQNVLRAPWH